MLSGFAGDGFFRGGDGRAFAGRLGWRGWWVALLLVSLALFSGWAQGATGRIDLSNAQLGAPSGAPVPVGASVTTERVHAQLLVHAPQGVAPGRTWWLGLRIEHQPQWHTYWRNPGDSGLATTMQWTLPAGWSAGDIAWPAPHPIALGDLVNYGYEGTVVLAVPVTVGSDAVVPADGAAITVGLQATWLVCRTECVPETGRFQVTLPARAAGGAGAGLWIEPITAHADVFAAAQAALPTPWPVPAASAASAAHAQVQGDDLVVRLEHLPAAWRGRVLNVLPEVAGVVNPSSVWKASWEAGVWTARVPLSPYRSASPIPLDLVLMPQAAEGAATTTAMAAKGDAALHAVRVQVPVPEGWPAVAAPAQVSPALQAALDANVARVASKAAGAPVSAASSATWVAALVGAVLGGLLLNLMPCVLPVLAIKVMGMTQQHRSPRARRMAGLAYSAGVVLSLVALGAAMLALRAGGHAVGWGFQLQSPVVVAALAGLFTLLALNLAGVFQVGSVIPSSWASLQARNPVTDAFLTGVLTVAIASPCTAPMMGASVGLTATLPAAQALGIFAALGLGLALPLALVSWLPAAARWIPRPGAWMETLRQLLAFPMLATVVWLLWVLGQQTGTDGAMALLAVLLALALAAWSLGAGSARLRRRSARMALCAGSLTVLALVAWGMLPHALRPLPPSAPASGASAAHGEWRPWSPGLPEQLASQGQTVFVDYTAAWCVTCQLNKRTTLSDPDLLTDIAAHNVALVRADWTLYNPDITAALAQLGRSGVPVYALHAPGRPPLVLSEIISVADVRAALATLPPPTAPPSATVH